MSKIIYNNRNCPTRRWQCGYCGSIFEFDESDISENYDYDENPSSRYVVCPICKRSNELI
jgi:rubredoxin